MRIGVVALSLAVTAAACGHLPPCPAAGGPAWTELQSAHFRLRTDEDAAAARATLVDLEQFWAAMLHAFGVPADVDTGRLPVLVVDRGWMDFAAPEVVGYFTHALFQPLAVMESSGHLFTQATIKHELIHYFSSLITPRQPPWLEEGLATYYETIEYDADAGRVTIGRPSPMRLRGARTLGVATIERMFTATKLDPDDPGRFESAAWITTHYLMNHRPQAVRSYLHALRAGATPEAAWTAAFGAETPAQVAAAVHAYLDGGRYTMLVYNLPPPKLDAPRERRLDDADAHAMRALLYTTGAGVRTETPRFSQQSDDEAKAAARREIDEALRQEPDNAAARAIAHFMLKAPIDPEVAAAVTRKNPGDWLGWVLLAAARGERGDTAGWNDAMTRASALVDRSVEVHATVVEKRQP
jgi:hypothetical protein